ncbi:MAG: hypothetical protein COA45_08520 [Zetaproteobacteria bacterium]|nr:MAG: hypothetical protein COA45_08520 [Zetaproteobacteria bacterium]
MVDQVNEQHVEYGGVPARIHSPENPTGLTFIAPGALVSMDAPLIQAIQKACEEEGRTVVVADLGNTPLITNDPSNVHGNFTKNLQQVIDGYCEDSNYEDNDFGLIGHSMGGAAVLSLADDYAVSAVTVLDPMPVPSEILQNIDCPVNVIISKVRSYRNPGKRMFNELDGYSDQHMLHEVETSKDMKSGHIFEGQEGEVAKIIRDYVAPVNKPSGPDVSFDLGEPG